MHLLLIKFRENIQEWENWSWKLRCCMISHQEPSSHSKSICTLSLTLTAVNAEIQLQLPEFVKEDLKKSYRGHPTSISRYSPIFGEPNPPSHEPTSSDMPPWKFTNRLHIWPGIVELYNNFFVSSIDLKSWASCRSIRLRAERSRGRVVVTSRSRDSEQIHRIPFLKDSAHSSS